MSRRTSRSSGVGAPRVETLVASLFAYEAFRHSASSSLKPKTLVEGPFYSSCYRLPSAIFVYHAPIGLHEVVPRAFPQSFSLTSLKLCYTVAWQLYGHPQLYIYIYLYVYRYTYFFFSLEFTRLSSRGTTNLLTSLREE